MKARDMKPGRERRRRSGWLARRPWPAPAGALALAMAATPALAEGQPPNPPPSHDAEAPVAPTRPPHERSLAEAILAGKPILEVRARYEDVDQANLVQSARSFSVRTHFGWQTAGWRGLTALVEGSNVFHADGGDYNVAVPGGASLNGRTTYPIINDPSATELNRAQIAWALSPMVTLTAGRQRVLIDDQRFVGNVGWRQNEQTFDAARADIGNGRLKATYVYVFGVNRIFGGPLNWASDSHLLNVSYALADPLRVEAFVYALEFGNAHANSSLTRGVKVGGKVPAGPVLLTYDGAWARQSDYRHATAPFALDYWQADLGATVDIVTLRADYEQLDGNGTLGFTTPLATTHAFQGWADAFAADNGNKTHVDGLRDANLALIVRPKWRFGAVSKVEAQVSYHDFRAELTDAYLGREWDAQVQTAVTRRITALVKVADFERAASVPTGTVAAPPSRTKVWVSLEYKL